MNETLSALMDDELEGAESDRCVARLEDERDLRESWSVYHLIGDTLRGHTGTALPASFAARLAAEPTVLAPQRRPAPRDRAVRRYALSIAASVAAVAFVGWMALPMFAPQSQLAGTPAPAGSGALAAAVVPVAHGMGDYLLAHQRFSPSSAMSGVAPYVRSVSEEGGK